MIVATYRRVVTGCLSEPGEAGVKANSIKPLGTSLPGLTIRRERKREGGWLYSDRGNVACLRRGGWMGATMISCGVEISIAAGVAEMEDANYCDRFSFFFFLLFFFPFFLFFFLNHMHLFKVQRQHSALTLWPTKTIPSSSPGNIQAPKSLWYETNRTSRLSPNQIL